MSGENHEVGDPLGPRGLETSEERSAAVTRGVASLKRRLVALRDALPPAAEPPPSGP